MERGTEGNGRGSATMTGSPTTARDLLTGDAGMTMA